ncbi:MAG: 2-hydroxyacid dehydrogenase [Ferroplasma sp.]|uniref:2-hydroxyacid dehydrogenase n=1 Tax=Ferroplasma sp. TaxID=2591003 RepID=UPI002815AB58|nr:2-hydroxyacid dehydrogenase [Ferroplasma sp.]WMT50483.1 MAG: 2-hydroxyacid dehydrogenase [Ferroplasma sp.]
MKISLQVNFSSMSVPDSLIKELEKETGCEITKGFSDDAEIVVFAGKPEVGRNTVFMQSVSAGVNHVNFKDIPENVTVCSNADAWSIPVAEHAFALLLSKYKNICKSNSLIRNGQYERELSESLYGKTLGIMGYGGIGREMARIASVFGMKSVGFGRTEPSDNNLDIFTTDKLYIPENADIMAITLPLNRYTNGFIDYELLKKFRGNIILNVGRAEVVRRDDMLDYLSKNPDKWFLTDVWWGEPKIEGKIPDNVIVTPHVAGLSKDYMTVPLKKAFQNVSAYLNGKPKNVVNRKDYI